MLNEQAPGIISKPKEIWQAFSKKILGHRILGQ